MSGATTAVTLAVTALSTATSIYSQQTAQKRQEKSAKNAASYNAQVAENEAATQKELARNEMQKGIADRERQQRNAQRQMGEMRANMGASGFTLDSETNLSLLEESAAEHQYDSNIIMQNANMAAWQREVAATNAKNQKNMFDYQNQNAGIGTTGSLLGTLGTGLNGVSQGLSQYKKAK